jgi:hypothetical protein
VLGPSAYRLFLAICLMCSVPSVRASQAAETSAFQPATSIGGSVRTALLPDLLWEDPHEDRFEWRSRIGLRLKHRFHPRWRVFIAAEARHELITGADTEAGFRFALDETFIEGSWPQWRFRAGNLRHRFGSNLLLSPTDVVNPVDPIRTFLDDDNARVPVPALLGEFNRDPVTVELIWAPFFVPAPASVTGRDFSLLRPGLAEDLVRSSSPTTGLDPLDDAAAALFDATAEAIADLDLQVREGALPKMALDNSPDAFAYNGDLGLRIKGRVPHFDASVGLWWATLDRPFITVDPDLLGPLLNQRLPTFAELSNLLEAPDELVTLEYRRQLAGFVSMSADTAGFVFSAEALFESRTVQYTTDAEPWSPPGLTSAASIRYTRGEFQIGLEGMHQWIIGADGRLAGGHPHRVTAALAARWRDGRDRLGLELAALFQAHTLDGLLRPTVSYDPMDGLTVALSATLLLGRHQELRSVRDLLRYDGGSASYYARNSFLMLSGEYRF